MAKENRKGQFVWEELLTTDPAAGQEFYTKVVGWGTTPFEGSDPPYVMWTAGEKPQGGVMELPEQAKKMGAPPHWMSYISTPDVDKTVKRARELGATVHVPAQYIPKVGRFAVLADPQGAAFSPFTPEGDAPNPPAEAGVGGFSWHELSTSDANAAWRFYADLFGWQKTEAMDMGGGNMYQMFGTGGPSVGGMSNKTDVPPSWLPYARVKDVKAAAERARSLGGKVILEPMEVPGGDLIVILMDPQGAVLGLHQKA